ncbi:MAG: aminotransferase class I/II-fold pyridoxal phosphate-dependent enzyme [Pseudomonadota bacterium]|nr:aminotransferase class I/II-fold pyridoxal phosphate-dependent enzyme [Pseudomonadota bacterium]
MLKVSSRSMIPPFIVMDVMRAANERVPLDGQTIHLEVGQPSTSAPLRVIEEAKRLLDKEILAYTEALGIAPLRKRIARYYQDFYSLDVDCDQIVITTGSSAGLLLACLSTFDAGDKVAVVPPCYPAHKNILKALNVNIVELPVDEKSSFQLSIDQLESLPEQIDGLIIASPSNPTGAMLQQPLLQGITQWCEDQGVRFISDEIYHGIVYDAKAETAKAYSESSIVINSFSKYFSMTGWRLGWMVVPKNLIRPVERLTQNLFISPPSLSQKAAVVVFDCMEELNQNVIHYKKNREIFKGGLPEAGLGRLPSIEGAFYAYVNTSAFTNDSEDFCHQMLNEAGIAATPGKDFDSDRGKHYVRFCFAGSTKDISEAIIRLKCWL